MGLALIVFFVLPYVTLVPTLKINGSKTEFAVFSLRLLLSFLFSLVGWVIDVDRSREKCTRFASRGFRPGRCASDGVGNGVSVNSLSQ